MFAISTLDSLHKLDDLYVRTNEDGDGAWMATKPLPSAPQAPCKCPECREPIIGIMRYGRAQKLAELSILEKKVIFIPLFFPLTSDPT